MRSARFQIEIGKIFDCIHVPCPIIKVISRDSIYDPVCFEGPTSVVTALDCPNRLYHYRKFFTFYVPLGKR